MPNIFCIIKTQSRTILTVSLTILFHKSLQTDCLIKSAFCGNMRIGNYFLQTAVIVLVDTEHQRKEREHQEDLQRLRGFRPIDDDFMRSLFKKNIELVQFVLQIIIEKPDLQVVSFETQADMKRVTGARTICLDAYATDISGKKYDIEIQRTDK